jgi:hypothetical protein
MPFDGARAFVTRLAARRFVLLLLTTSASMPIHFFDSLQRRSFDIQTPPRAAISEASPKRLRING